MLTEKQQATRLRRAEARAAKPALGTPRTLKTAARLRALLLQRAWMSDANWLEKVSTFCNDAKYGFAHHLVGSVKQASKDATPDVHGFGPSIEVIAFAQKHKIVLDKKSHYWLMTQGNRLGHIHGLEDITGIPGITNGIDLWIECADGRLIKGHRDFWVWHRKPRQPREAAPNGSTVASATRIPPQCINAAKTILAKGDAGVDAFAEAYQKRMGRLATLMLDSDEEAVATLSKAINEYLEAGMLEALT